MDCHKRILIIVLSSVLKLPPITMFPRDPHNKTGGKIIDPITEPTIKKGRAIIIRPELAPKLNNTPEPQPLANCMPIPNKNAPIKSESDTGATLPDASIPHNSAGIKIKAQIAARQK